MGRLVFMFGDCLFLALIGAASVATMHLAHMPDWPFLVEMVLGMTGAMCIQMLLALLVAPILGSIESMVPSMIVAMATPMLLCAAHLVGLEPGWSLSLRVGAALGAAAFVAIECYGIRCRRALKETAGWGQSS